MKGKTHEEWLVQIQQRYWVEHGDTTWTNAYRFYADRGQYAATETEAKRVLDHAYQIFNGKKIYNSKGERYETQSEGMIGIQIVSTKESDRNLEIVNHRIQKRIVTEWEDVEI